MLAVTLHPTRCKTLQISFAALIAVVPAISFWGYNAKSGSTQALSLQMRQKAPFCGSHTTYCPVDFGHTSPRARHNSRERRAWTPMVRKGRSGNCVRLRGFGLSSIDSVAKIRLEHCELLGKQCR